MCGVFVGPDIHFRFVVANPGLMAWIHDSRPLLNLDYTCKNYCVAKVLNHTRFVYGLPNKMYANNSRFASCQRTSYKQWPYGLNSPNENGYGYMNFSLNVIPRYLTLDVRHLQGDNDTCVDQKTFFGNVSNSSTCGCNDHEFPAACSAGLEGHCRLMRGLAYFQLVKKIYPEAPFRLRVVHGWGHTAAIFTDPLSAEFIFGQNPTSYQHKGGSSVKY
jgi:hypothetical protein